MKIPTKFIQELRKIKLDQVNIKFVKNFLLKIKEEQLGINLKLKG